MHKNALTALLGMAALIAVILLSEPNQDTAIEHATADSVQDAIQAARLVAMNRDAE